MRGVWRTLTRNIEWVLGACLSQWFLPSEEIVWRDFEMSKTVLDKDQWKLINQLSLEKALDDIDSLFNIGE